MVEIAKKEGVEKATEQETIDNITRKYFPSAYKYKKNMNEGKDIIFNTIDSLYDTLIKHCDESDLAFVNGMKEATQKILKAGVEAFKKISNDEIKEKISRIYKK